METANCAPHGLWQISLDQGLAQISSFGFNTVRLPYSSECLHASGTTSISAAKNPGLVGKTPLELMDIVVARAEAHGLSVILDRHRPDSAAQSALWYTSAYPESAWLADWRMLANRYRETPTVIGADLHNEPHGAACWSCADAGRDWAAAATRAGNAILGVNPRLLVIVEGVEHQANGADTWWGGGLSDAAAHPITLAVASRLVYSAHDYPASVASQPWFSAPDYPANLPGQWDKTWGYLQKTGVAPVLLGEFGTKLETTSDRQWLAALVSYLHDRRMSYAYWSFNPNSGDTGGLVADDWVTPQVAKLTALRPLGITSWSRYDVDRVRSGRRAPLR
jgi:endoglucanase